MQTYTFYTPAFSKGIEAESDRDALAEAMRLASYGDERRFSLRVTGEDGTVIRVVAVVLY